MAQPIDKSYDVADTDTRYVEEIRFPSKQQCVRYVNITFMNLIIDIECELIATHMR
jgi:hypothetical protein